MSLSDLISHDEHRRSTMTRARYLARIGKIRTFEKLEAAQIVANRYTDGAATALILDRRAALNLSRELPQETRAGVPARGSALSHPYPQLFNPNRRTGPSGNRQRNVVASGTIEIDWEGYDVAQQEQAAGEGAFYVLFNSNGRGDQYFGFIGESAGDVSPRNRMLQYILRRPESSWGTWHCVLLPREQWDIIPGAAHSLKIADFDGVHHITMDEVLTYRNSILVPPEEPGAPPIRQIRFRKKGGV